jgi:L-fuconolactonase
MDRRRGIEAEDGTMIRVDAHHHVWRLDRGDYGWLRPSAALQAIYRDFDLDELRPQLRRAGIDASVLVQAAPTVQETQFLLEVARQNSDVVRGVVGWADLAATDAPDVLARMASNAMLKSVRPMLQDAPDARWILRPEVQRALAAMPGLGLRFDALVKSQHLQPLLRVLDQRPDLAVIVDHCAKPGVAHGEWQPWADDLAAIARHPTACCKLSGLVTEAGANWSVPLLRRYVDHVLDCFGSERVIWGSDWPVVTLAASYARWNEATDELLAGLSPEARTAVRGENAIRSYGLDARAQ